ncbi:MAG: tyrosine-type recombinase/integrase [Kofleriaceae bacterium]
MIALPPLVQMFFAERLVRQRCASPNTIASYRDTFRIFLGYAERRLGKSPTRLHFEDLDAPIVSGFLDHLEAERGNHAKTRNVRFAALRSFFRFVAIREPSELARIQRVLAIPLKRVSRKLVPYLDRTEIEALLAAPDRSTWLGRRDHLVILFAVQTGLRVSELIGVRATDLVLGSASHVRCTGKGRKERCTPLTKQVTRFLRQWLAENHRRPDDLVFSTRDNSRLSRDAVERLVARHRRSAEHMCPSLSRKHVTPHVLRHTTAVQLLQAGVDRAVIALWLGHESVETTQMYLDADLKAKDIALARTAPHNTRGHRFKPKDRLLAFLEGL